MQGVEGEAEPGACVLTTENAPFAMTVTIVGMCVVSNVVMCPLSPDATGLPALGTGRAEPEGRPLVVVLALAEVWMNWCRSLVGSGWLRWGTDLSVKEASFVFVPQAHQDVSVPVLPAVLRPDE